MRLELLPLVTMFIHVDHTLASPGAEEVSSTGSQSHSQAQPHVVRHKDEHEPVAEDKLDHVQAGL